MNHVAANISKPGFAAITILVIFSVAIALFTGQYLWMFAAPVLLVFFLGASFPELVFYGLIFTIPLSVELQITPSLGTDFPDESIMWMLTAILPFQFLNRKEEIIKLTHHPLMILLVASLCWTFITIFYSAHPMLSVKFLLAKIWYIVPFCLGTVLYLRNKLAMMKAAKCLVISMCIAALIIVARQALVGFGFDQVNQMARPIFRNHVNYAALLVCVIPISFALYKNAEKNRGWWLTVTIFLLTALMLSYSRGAWLALAAALITIYVVIKNRLALLIIAISILLVSIIAWFASDNRYLDYRTDYERTIYHSDFNEHLLATYKMHDLSTAERFYRWIAAFRMSKERLMTGYGPNSFYYEYRPYAVNAFTTYVSRNDEHSTVHNYYLLLLVEQGLPGLILFLLLFFSMMLYAQRIYHRSSDPWDKGLMLLVVSLLSMIAVLIFLSDLMENDKIGSIFFICLGLLVAGTKTKTKELI